MNTENKEPIKRIIIEGETKGRIYTGIGVHFAQSMFRTHIPKDEMEEFNQSFPGQTYDVITPQQETRQEKLATLRFAFSCFVLGVIVATIVETIIHNS